MTKHAIEPTPMGDKPYYVYIHFYPEGYIDPEGLNLSGIVFYVGKGTVAQSPSPQRIDMHEAEANNGGSSNERKIRAIQQIWAAGKSVGKRITFETWDEDEAYRVEGETIEQHAGPYLTNRQVRFPRKAHVPVRVEDVADQLRKQILAGEFGKGRLPAGEDLADQYRTSRDTTHRAMKLLQSDGLLIAKGKRGLVINYRQRDRIPSNMPFDLALQSIGQKAVETQLGKMMVVPVPTKIARALSIKEGVPAVHQILRRGTATTPYQLAEIFYPEAFVSREILERSPKQSDMVKAIEENHHKSIVRVRDELIIRLITTRESEILAVPFNTLIYDVHRVSYAEDNTAVMVENLFLIANAFILNYDGLVLTSDEW